MREKELRNGKSTILVFWSALVGRFTFRTGACIHASCTGSHSTTNRSASDRAVCAVKCSSCAIERSVRRSVCCSLSESVNRKQPLGGQSLVGRTARDRGAEAA